jgi:hypothetical protein
MEGANPYTLTRVPVSNMWAPIVIGIVETLALTPAPAKLLNPTSRITPPPTPLLHHPYLPLPSPSQHSHATASSDPLTPPSPHLCALPPPCSPKLLSPS